MSDRASVEKTVTESMLTTGEITIGVQEQERLGFPHHSDVFAVVTGAEELPVAWTAGRRRLSGEALQEFLQDTARIGDLLRLELRGGDLSLVVLSPLRGFDPAAPGRPSSPPPPARTDGRHRLASARRRGSRGDRFRLRHRDEYVWHEGVGLLRSANELLLGALLSRGWDPREAVEMRLAGEELATLDQFEELLALDAAHIEHMPHQEAAARTALTRLGGRAVLADEVGLGKTIEAGLVIKELLLRGLAERMLIVCPAPLRDQWRDELREKFEEQFEIVSTGTAEFFRGDRLIMTPQLAIRNAHRLTNPFDLVVIDEAHRLTGTNARRSRAVFGELLAAAPRALLLTATPVQNNLLELYRLVELLRPGTFQSQSDFASRFLGSHDIRCPVNAPELRKLVSSVIIRTTREQAGVDKVHRMPPRDQGVWLTSPERTLYDLIVETLRHRMTAPGDAMRRRSLALRLTASPQAISRSALRMADSHPDPELRKVLAEIGDLAADIRHPAREQAALAVIRQWLHEHGRVLVFTQHTETLLGIQRFLHAEGIVSAPFHGGMAHSARAVSVADFKSGVAPVLVSTDAGAEGQNLQVSNCVLNYDLPWNPMRVEQRIGRVHRLTQTRNVHIANLFARDTIDESVYRLLHDKLAMFELLFGQVVTVLGELGDGQDSATMETRVLGALYEDDDATMRRRLDELGRQLEDARGRATQMMDTAGDLSQWLAQRHEERRSRAAQPQAGELLPDATERPRRRQREVERFVREFLGRAGAQLDSPSDQFAVATLIPDLSVAFDGREKLYLAFSHAALDAHPEAELCVVGAEIFDEILRALRERGDLTGTVARIPVVDLRPRVAHAPQLRLVARRLEPAPDWSGRATFRVQVGATTGSQHISTVEIGAVPPAGPGREQIPDGAQLPGDLTGPAVMAAIETAAATQLRDELSQAQTVDRERQAQANTQVRDNLQRQLAETEQQLRWGSSREELLQRHQQLRRALDATQQTTITSEMELRAELLTLELHGSSDLVAVETWQNRSGVTRELTYPWTTRVPEFTCEATAKPVRTLALCAKAHVVDAAALSHCPICEGDSCGACGPAQTPAPCAACGVVACGSCRDGGVLCTGCRDPRPDPALDRPGERAWRLGAGTVLRVAHHHAVLTNADGVEKLVSDGPGRDRIRSVAARLGLSASAGLRAGPSVPTDEMLSDGAAWCHVDRSVWWTVAPDGGGDIDPSVVDCLPDLPAPLATAETDTGLAQLLNRLRDRLPPATPPAVVAMPFVVVQRVDIEGAALVYREIWHDGTGDPMIAVVERASPVPSRHDPVENGEPVAATVVGTVRVEIDRLHRSYVCRLSDDSHTELAFLPADGASIGIEATLARQLAEARLPARRVVRHPWPGTSLDDLPAPRAATGVEVDRRQAVVWALVTGDAGTPVTQAPPPEAWRGPPVRDHARAADLRRALDLIAGELLPVSLAPCLAVDETWQSRYGSARRRYLIAPGFPLRHEVLDGRVLVAPGEGLSPPADDFTTGRPLSVDSDGHLHDPASVVDCPVCLRTYGQCCADAQVVNCGDCARPACRECRRAKRTDIRLIECQRCGDRACAGCSRRLETTDCALCGRQTCSACLGAGDACATCERLEPATDDEIAALPDILAAAGLTVLVGHDEGSTVAVLLGRHRSEVVVLRDGLLLRWETSVAEPRPLTEVRLAAARRCGIGDVAVVAVGGPPCPVPDDVLVVHREDRTELLWEVTTAAGRQCGNATALHGRKVDRPFVDLYADLAAAMTVATDHGRVPAPATSARPRLEAMRSGHVARPEPATVTVSRRSITDVVFLGPAGMYRRSNADGTVDGQLARWDLPEGDVDWALQGWAPRPDVVAVAGVGDFSAAVGAVGRHALLSVRRPDRTVWSPISEDSEDLLRGAVGAHLTGETTLLSVTAMTAPTSRYTGPVVNGAVRGSHQATLYAEVEPDGRIAAESGHTGDTVPILEVVKVLGVPPASLISTPPCSVALPARLRHALRAMVRDREVPRPAARVGLRVREAWWFPNRAYVVADYLVPGGETVGYLTDAATGEQLRSAYACRSSHLVAKVEVCWSCATASCGACVDRSRPCAICGVSTCGRCVTPDLRCRVCIQLRRVGPLGRLSHGVGRGDDGWVASVARTRVIVRRVGATLRVDRTDRGAHTGRQLVGEDASQALSLLPV